jgi:hypothetical protein
MVNEDEVARVCNHHAKMNCSGREGKAPLRADLCTR